MDFNQCPSCKEKSIVRDNCIDNGLGYGTMDSNNAPIMGDPVRMGHIKPSSGFRDMIKEIHRKTHGSTLNNTRYYD